MNGKRNKRDHLTNKEKMALRAAIMRGAETLALIERFNVSERTIGVHRAKIQGRPSYDPGDGARHFPQFPFCRHGDCMEEGKGRPPYCDAHRPEPRQAVSIPWPIPLHRLTAGRA